MVRKKNVFKKKYSQHDDLMVICLNKIHMKKV